MKKLVNQSEHSITDQHSFDAKGFVDAVIAIGAVFAYSSIKSGYYLLHSSEYGGWIGFLPKSICVGFKQNSDPKHWLIQNSLPR